jgi:hypothetical protein
MIKTKRRAIIKGEMRMMGIKKDRHIQECATMFKEITPSTTYLSPQPILRLPGTSSLPRGGGPALSLRSPLLLVVALQSLPMRLSASR